MDAYNVNYILYSIRLHLLGEKVYNKCVNGEPLQDDELTEITKHIFFPNHDEENEEKINEAKNNIIRLCQLKINPRQNIQQLISFIEIKELPLIQVKFKEYSDKNNMPDYVERLMNYRLRDGKQMFTFGEIEINPSILYHGSFKLFDHPYLLENIVNRLTYDPTWAKVYASKNKSGEKLGFIYAYSLDKNIENIIQYNGSNMREVSEKMSESGFPQKYKKTQFGNYMSGDELYPQFCSSNDYINNINGIFAPHHFCEKQLILCKDGEVKLYLKNIYIYNIENKKIYQLL